MMTETTMAKNMNAMMTMMDSSLTCHSKDNQQEEPAGTAAVPPRVVLGRRPKRIVQVDQYGVIHAPFAAARAFLSEYGFGDCRVLVQKGGNEKSPSADKIEIMEVSMVDIAPHAPKLGKLHHD